MITNTVNAELSATPAKLVTNVTADAAGAALRSA
jgi:hypothetical protein